MPPQGHRLSPRGSDSNLGFFSRMHRAICGILVTRPGNEPGPMAVEVTRPDRWAARELPKPVLCEPDTPCLYLPCAPSGPARFRARRRPLP